MTREDWKQRKESDIVGSKALKNIIDDYESKLCQMHSEILVLKSDVERYKEETNKAEKKLKEAQESSSRGYTKTRYLEKALNAEVEKHKRLIKIIRAQWWKRGAMLQMLKEDLLTITRGW